MPWPDWMENSPQGEREIEEVGVGRGVGRFGMPQVNMSVGSGEHRVWRWIKAFDNLVNRLLCIYINGTLTFQSEGAKITVWKMKGSVSQMLVLPTWKSNSQLDWFFSSSSSLNRSFVPRPSPAVWAPDSRHCWLFQGSSQCSAGSCVRRVC